MAELLLLQLAGAAAQQRAATSRLLAGARSGIAEVVIPGSARDLSPPAASSQLQSLAQSGLKAVWYFQ